MFIRNCIAAFLLIGATPALAQADPVFVEGLPAHIERRIAADTVTETLAKASGQVESLRGIVSGIRRWHEDDALRVCFFGGSRELRSRIVSIAQEWTTGNSPVTLDFGDANDPRICGRGLSHIRVGYDYSGYWSLVGRDSLVYASQLEQSLNLGRFNVNPPSDQEFRRVVLHEFGHALGFQHEHQNPLSSCASDFNWPYIISYLKGSPNYWDEQTINHNLRELPYLTSDINSGFDRQSIMLYTFPTNFYINGTSSSCYSPGNYSLSAGDLETLRTAYANREDSLQRLAAFATGLDGQERALIEDRLAFFRLGSDQAVLASSLAELQGATPTFSQGISQLLVFEPVGAQMIEGAAISEGPGTLPS